MTPQEKTKKFKRLLGLWLSIVATNIVALIFCNNTYVITGSMLAVIVYMGAFIVLYAKWWEIKRELKYQEEQQKAESLPPASTPVPVCAINPDSLVLGYGLPRYFTTITITNHNGIDETVRLFDRMREYYVHPLLSIEIKTEIFKGGKVDEQMTISYKEFCYALSKTGLISHVVRTTDNRALSFHNLNIFQGIRPIQPRLTVEKKRRTEEETWNPDECNIADTQEQFFLNANSIIEVKVKNKETFVIELEHNSIESGTFAEFIN